MRRLLPLVLAAVLGVSFASFSRLDTLQPGTDEYETVLAGSIALTAVTGIVLGLAFMALFASGFGRPEPIHGPRNVPRLVSRRPVTLTVLLWFVVVALLGSIAFRYLNM